MAGCKGHACRNTKRYFLVLLFFCTSMQAHAQKWVPGYVLLNNGDTLHGLIESGNWVKVPLKVRFRKSATAEIHTYSPLLIHSFRIKGGDWYFSFVGDIDPSSLQDDQLTYNPFPDTLRVSMYIRAIVLGKMSLYYARDLNDRLHLFIQKDGGAIMELKYKKYYTDETVVADFRNQITRRAIMANQIYKEQLTNLMADCPPVAIGIVSQSLAYAKNDMMQIVMEYNKCKSSRTIYSEKKEPWRLEVRAHAGINFSGLKFESTADTYTGNTEMEHALGYALGLSLNAVIPRTNNSWGIYNQLLLRNYHASGTTGTAPFKDQLQVNMDLMYIKLGTMARYQFQSAVLRPFLQAGITNGLALKTTNLVTDSSGITTDFLPFFRTYEQGILIGTGIQWKSISAEVQIEFSNAMSGASAVKSTFTTWYVTMVYRF